MTNKVVKWIEKTVIQIQSDMETLEKKKFETLQHNFAINSQSLSD
jgi:hypothetical protein